MSASEQVSNRVALVTGASYGIGAASALTLARDGYDIALADLREDMLADTAAKITAIGRRVALLTLDLRQQSSVEAAAAKAITSLGRLDVLVNNAGVPQRKPALDVTRDEWALVMDVNLAGTFFMTQAVARGWIAAGKPGSVVSVASTHGLVGLAQSTTYGVSKAGISHMTRMLAIEWAEHGIRVNAIAPASTETPTRTGLSDPNKRDTFLSRIPLHRFGTPQDMAEGIAYLAGEKAGFITGQTLVIDGGLTSQ